MYEDNTAAQVLAIMLNDPRTTELVASDYDWDYISNMPLEFWEKIGRAIANNIHLRKVQLTWSYLNDETMPFLFRGLTGSNNIEDMVFHTNDITSAGVRTMLPFLQNANNLTYLNLRGNEYVGSEGFNMLFRALRDSPIQTLDCDECGIESIEINTEHIPKQLKVLKLAGNSIDSAGCREVAKLLQGGAAALTELHLEGNGIGDKGVEILAGALQSNTTLKHLDLMGNFVSKRGEIMLLKLVNDIASIESTLKSNHTLTELYVNGNCQHRTNAEREIEEGTIVKESWVAGNDIQREIDSALMINRTLSEHGPLAIGKEKIILRCDRRAASLCILQEDVENSVFCGMGPLHLPEVLSLIGRKHGLGELYVALLSSVGPEMLAISNWAEKQPNDADASCNEKKRKRKRKKKRKRSGVMVWCGVRNTSKLERPVDVSCR